LTKASVEMSGRNHPSALVSLTGVVPSPRWPRCAPDLT
jgi:hypothetical protein